jgi:ABC-2 type transport system permease protein
VIRRVAGFLVAIAVIVLVYAALRMLAGTGPQFTARSIVGVGAFASVAALVLPAIAAQPELMPARAFVGCGIRRAVLVPVLAAFTMLGPALLLVPLLLAPMAVWSGADRSLAFGCGLLLLLQTVLSLRIGAAIGAAARGRRRLRGWTRGIGVVLLLLVAAPAAAVVVTRALLLVPDGRAPGARLVLQVLRPIDSSPAIDVIAASPLGALWAAPGLPSLDHGDRVGAAVLVGVASVAVLAAIWALVVVLQLRPTWPQRRAVVGGRALGWFGPLPSSPIGAITARSFSYWVRDPRYRSVLVMLPVIPVLTLLALWVGGVPFSSSVLVPLPMMVLVLAWSTSHNDVAYDHTAVWQHLAASTRGVHDRIGRLWPPLVFGGILVLIGSPLTAWGYGDGDILPAVLGVNSAVLLGSVGVGSGLSVRFPYAAPHPGDGAFRYPQVSGGAGGAAQAVSVLLVVLTAAPAMVASALWLLGIPGPWNWVALLVGLVVGAVTLVLGVLGGGRGFDRRGPELLAFAMRN